MTYADGKKVGDASSIRLPINHAGFAIAVLAPGGVMPIDT